MEKTAKTTILMILANLEKYEEGVNEAVRHIVQSTLQQEWKGLPLQAI